MVFVPIFAPNVALFEVFKVDVVMLWVIIVFKVLVPLTEMVLLCILAPKVALLVTFRVSKLPDPVTRRLMAAIVDPKVAAAVVLSVLVEILCAMTPFKFAVPEMEIELL